MATYSPKDLGINASTTGGVFKQGGHYGGRQFWNGTLGEPGQLHPESDQIGAGQAISQDVIKQTNPNNVSFIDSQIKASDIKAPAQIPYSPTSNSLFSSSGLTSEVDNYRKTLETTLATQKLEADTKLQGLRDKETETLAQVKELTKPFREELETAERERLYVNENFEANQQLVGELEQLLTEGNDLIRQQQGVTGLAAVRNPRIQKSMDDVAARTGAIQAVINARNGQIAQAQNLIDRSVSAITADRSDQISYYETVLNLNNRDIISLDTESKKLAEDQLNLKKGDLANAQATANYVKELLLNPTTAGLMGEAGVKLNDSVEQINSKITQATYAREVRDLVNEQAKAGNTSVLNPTTVPADQLLTVQDSQGKTYYFRAKGTASSGSTAVNDFLLKTLGGTGTQTIKDITQPVTNDQLSDILSIANEVIAPKVTPTAGIGSLIVDSLGRQWRYEKKGWVLLN